MRKNYAQMEQDLIALEFFRFHPVTHKIFLDVGAFDGISFSNTRLLFEQGWNGVCMEPVLKNYQKLESLYRDTNVITIRAAAADYEGEMVLNVATVPWAEDWGSDVSSPSDDALERWPEYIWEKESVPVMTVNTILKKNDMLHVDFVSIDVEGHEKAVLRGFDLQMYSPDLLVVEYSSRKGRMELIHYMKQHGYSLWVDNGQDIFFVHNHVLKNWKVFLFGAFQRFRFSKLGKYVTRLARCLSK